jgi:hypothetical protein
MTTPQEAPKVAEAAESKSAASIAASITTDVPEVEAPRTAEQIAQEAEEDEAFGAGFKEIAQGDKPRAESRPTEPVVTPKPKAEAPAKPAPAAPAVATVVTPEPAVVYAKAGEVEELRKHIATNHDKVMGTFGEIRAAIKASAANPSGQPVKVTKEALKNFRDAGYEEIADLLETTLNGIALPVAGTTFDQAAYDKTVDDKVAVATTKLQRDTEVKLLDARHPDFRECFAAADFQEWRKTLPAEAIYVLDHEWDSTRLAGAITDFKAWRAKAADSVKTDADAAAAKEAADAAARNQDKRLESAIAPATGGAPASGQPNDDDAFEAGFKQVQAAPG